MLKTAGLCLGYLGWHSELFYHEIPQQGMSAAQLFRQLSAGRGQQYFYIVSLDHVQLYQSSDHLNNRRLADFQLFCKR